MKRLILLAIAVFWVMIPWVSSAKTVISDSELDAVIAEQGVSINFTALTVGGTTTLTSASWGDSDGFGSGSTYPNSGYAGLNAVAIAGNLSVINGAMNVDVGTSGTRTIVNMLLPTITLGTMSMNATMMMSQDVNLGSGNDLAYVTVQNLAATLNGTIKVYAH